MKLRRIAVLMARLFVVVILVLGTMISSAQTPPVIVGQPLNQLVISGSNAVFSVAATGDNPGFQWYFNDTNAIVGAISPMLFLTNVQTAQAGNYSVSVSNVSGSVTSADALLTVLPATINPYTFGTLGYDLFEGTYEKAGRTNSRTAWYNPNASNLGTNTAVWTWPINLSCVGYASDGYESVLIASNELLTCGHYGGEAGQTVTFHDTNGVPWVAIVTNTVHPIADLVIAQLSNSAPASIVIPYVLPPNYTNYISGHTLLGMPAFWLHKNTGHIDYAPVADLGDYGWYGYGTWMRLNHANYSFSGSSATGGDSGALGFLSWSNCPVLMFATTLAGDAGGLFVSGLTNWNSMAALGLTNGMNVLNVSVYPPQPATLSGNGALPDLTGGGLTVTPSIQPATWGDPVEVDGTVENIGSGAAGAFDIGFFLSTNLDYSGFVTWLNGDVYVDGLNPNSSQFFLDDSLLSVAMPATNPQPGVTNYYIGMYVNAGLEVPVIPESNSTNNVSFCSTLFTLPSGLPQILATSSTVPFTNLTVNFDNVANTGATNAVETETVTIINNGSGLVEITNVILSGSTDFSILSVADNLQTSFVNLSSLPLPLQPNGQEIWTITLQFAPTTNGPETATLTVTNNDPVTPVLNLTLSGTGVPAPQLALTTPTTLISFGGQVDDGSGGSQTTLDILIQNNGTGPLTVSQNGISLLTGTQFNIVSMTSSTQGTINLSSGPGTIAAGGVETWDLKVTFDPLALGVLNDSLQILSDDPNNPAFVLSLQGQGLSPAQLMAGFTGTPTNGYAPLQVVFSDASSGSITNWLWDFGDGNTITNNTNGDVTNTYAATGNYAVTLTVEGAGGSNTVTQTNYVSVLQTNSVIFSSFSSAQGVSPSITLNTPARQLNVSAGALFTFSWQTTDPNPSATINLYLNANYSSSSGLIPIANGLLNSAGTSCVWQAGSALAGTNYYVYATMTDGTVAGSFAPGQLQIDPVGAFQLLSGIVATNASYVWQYSYYGTNYTGTNQLVLGANVISVTNGAAIYQFIVTRVPSLTQVEAVQYNPLNQVTTTTNGNGIVTTLTLDPLGRLIKRQSSNGALVTYGYDVLGNRTNMVDYTGTTFYCWDALNRLTNVIISKSGVLGASDNLSLSYEYNLAGHETAVVYPGGERIQYSYDNAGRLATVNNVTRALSFQYTYNPVTGQLTKLTRPNGIETDYSYDGMGRLTNILHQLTGSGSLLAQYGYTLDAIGKATLLTTTLPDNVIKFEQYSYDYFDRLTNAIYDDSGVLNDSNALNVSYTYDGNGNRLTMTTKTNNAVTEIRSYAYGNENRLLTVTNQTGVRLNAYFYDTAGNRIQKIATNYIAFYTYDERNLMIGYGDNTNQILYAYNGDAQRVSRTLNGLPTGFVIDPNRNIYEVVQERSSGSIMTSYTFGTTRLATSNGSAVTFELTDRLGSVRMVTDVSGNVLQSYNYDVFGAIR